MLETAEARHRRYTRRAWVVFIGLLIVTMTLFVIGLFLLLSAVESGRIPVSWFFPLIFVLVIAVWFSGPVLGATIGDRIIAAGHSRQHTP